MKTFDSELRDLINQYSKENRSDTPDFILAKYLQRCLLAFDAATVERDTWYGVHLEPGNKYFNIVEESTPSFSIKVEECVASPAPLSAEEVGGDGIGVVDAEEIEKAR